MTEDVGLIMNPGRAADRCHCEALHHSSTQRGASLVMKRSNQLTYATLAIVALTTGLTDTAVATPITFSVGGNNTAASIQSTVDAFRNAAGNPVNPNVAGSFPSGRREINWDGVLDGFAAPNNLPNNFFNANSPRGAEFSTPGTAVQVSANAGIDAVEFGTINPTYPDLFATFSPQRLFTAIGSNVVDINFFVSGSSTPAAVSAFGSVFTDVDLANTTKIEYFDPTGSLLTSIFAPVGTTGNESLSFAGVAFDAGEQIARVRITNGNTALGAGVNEIGSLDLVVMDDFIYAEPQARVSAVPEPTTLILMMTGLAALALSRQLRRQ